MTKISVIIPAYNEEKYLPKTLSCIQNQTFKDFEVIVVCNGCTDNSFNISKMYFEKVYNLDEKNVSKARNFGAKKANSDLLIFLDADILLGPKVLEKIISSKIKEYHYGTVKGKGKGFKNNFYLLIKNSVNKFKPWSHGLVYCSKENFFKIGGFNESLTKGELRDFFSKIKGKYKRLNIYVSPSDRRIVNWGISKLLKFWLFEKRKKDYEAIR